MQRLTAALEIDFKKLTKQDWDKVLIICGDEGISKSNLALHIFDWWFTKLYGKVEEKDIDRVALYIDKFAKAIGDVKQYEMVVYDESGDLSNKRTMSKVNVSVTQAYQVIRGLNIFTILVIPSIFDLDGFFVKRRARSMINVYRRGRFAYWNKSRLRRLVEINQNYYYKNIWAVKPLFYDTFPKYEGVLAAPYKKLKDEKIDVARKALLALITPKESFREKKYKKECEILSNKMVEDGYTKKEISKLLGLNDNGLAVRNSTKGSL